MPTYAYACTECGHRFEAVQAFTDASLTECPECTGRLRKLFSAVGIVFKGSGFYRTDSRKAASSPDKNGPDKKGSDRAKEAASAGASGSSDGSKANPSSSTTSTTVAEKKAS